MRQRWKTKRDFVQHLRSRRLELGKSQEEVSAALGKSPSYIYQVERGRAIPSAEVLIELSRIYREDPEDYLAIRTRIGHQDEALAFWKQLLSREAKNVYIAGSRRVPVIDISGPNVDEELDAKGYPTGVAKDHMLAHTTDDHAFYVRVNGDSMSPHIEPGDLVLIEPNAPVQNGDLVFARTEQGPVVKRLHITEEDRLMLLSLNSNYPPIEIRRKRGFRYFKAAQINREL